MSDRPISTVIVKPNEQDKNIEQILESAVVVSWADLMRGRGGLVHVEYGFAPSGALDYVQVWSSLKRGYWLLACTYQMSASQTHGSGIHFDNGYKSDGLAHILEVVMQHQNVFALPRDFGRQGLVQVVTPTEKESQAAAASMANAFDRVKSHVEPPLPSESERALVPQA
jgi:hypothetical protein